jgi:hypothetical protein
MEAIGIMVLAAALVVGAYFFCETIEGEGSLGLRQLAHGLPAMRRRYAGHSQSCLPAGSAVGRVDMRKMRLQS